MHPRPVMGNEGNNRDKGGSMTGWVGNIEEATTGNGSFRKVLFTGANVQLTVMSLHPGEEIGVEMQDHLDQVIRGG